MLLTNLNSEYIKKRVNNICKKTIDLNRNTRKIKNAMAICNFCRHKRKLLCTVSLFLVFCYGKFYCNIRQLFDVKDILFSSKLNKIRGSKILNTIEKHITVLNKRSFILFDKTIIIVASD